MQLAEKYQLIRKLARSFAETELTPEILDEVEDTGIFPAEIQKKMAETGFYGIKVPEKYGGQGSDHLAYAITIEEFARVSAVGSLYVNSPNSLGGMPILIAGTEEQKQKYLRPMVEGDVVIPFGLTEPGGGSDAGDMRTTAVPDGDYYILNGRKTFITMAPFADYSVIYANTGVRESGKRGITAFIVDMKLPGVSLGKEEQKLGLVGCATSDVILEDVRVHKDDILGRVGEGFTDAMKCLDVGRIGVAAQSLGIAQGAYDRMIDYMMEREQFGVTLSRFDTLRFEVARIRMQLESARLLVYRAADNKDKGLPYTAEAAMAKLAASEAAVDITRKSIQFHGGYGYMADRPIERMYRDAKITEIYEGTSQVHQMVIAADTFAPKKK